MLLRDTETSEVYRVVSSDDSIFRYWLINVDDDSWPFCIGKSLVHSYLENGKYQVELEDTWRQCCSDVEDSRAAARLNIRYALIEPLLARANEIALLRKRSRRVLVLKRVTDAKCSRQTIERLLKLFWKRGMNLSALRTDYSKCGGRGKRHKAGDKKIGRPRTKSLGVGINADEEMYRRFRIAADYYLTQKKVSLKTAHDYLVQLFYSSHCENEQGQWTDVQVEPEKRPTVRQLHYYIVTHHSNSEIKRKRLGDHHYLLHERELPSTADSDIQGPGDRFEIDATVADVYLVSQFDRRRIVGRPVIYFAVDSFSRMIVGLYVGFEGPSWVGAMMVLANMVTPKAAFCSHYQIAITPDQWPSHHAPSSILADRGELLSLKLGHNIIKELGIEIGNTGSKRADMKALVERRFGIVPAIFKPFTPGYVEPDFGERCAKDYRLQARLNLFEFTQLVIYAVIEHNNEDIKGIRVPAGMITEGLTPSPLDMWKWGIQHRSGRLKYLSLEEVQLNVMPEATAKITEHGIQFKKGYYSCPTAIRENWFALSRKKSRDVTIGYDHRDLSCIYLKHPLLPNGYEQCVLRERSLDFLGKSLFEIEELEYGRSFNCAVNEAQKQGQRILHDHKMAQIEDNATRECKTAQSGLSKSQKIKQIRANKGEEKAAQRLEERFLLASPAAVEDVDLTNPTSELGHGKTTLEHLRVLRAQREEE